MKPRRGVVLISIVLLLVSATALARPEDSSPSASDAERVPNEPSWGGRDRVLYHVGRFEIAPFSSSTPFAQDKGWYSLAFAGTFGASLHLPSGAQVTYLELDYCDTAAVVDVSITLYDCHFLGENCVFYGSLSSDSGDVGCSFVSADLTALNIVIDNNTRFYEIRGATVAGNGSTQIIGAYVGYKLQVSPAPSVATFPNDVPTSHPFFQFVEALAKAGITAGCAPGSFCPDAPLTRGEMAVFLSAALGLHFPN